MAQVSSLSRLGSPLEPISGDQVARERELFQAFGFGPPRNTKPGLMLDPFGVWPRAHNAFPSLVRRASTGTVMAVIRGASNHVTSRDGSAYLFESPDLGRTWTTPTLIAAGTATHTDLRDPCISEGRDGRLWLVYFLASASLAAAGVYVKYSPDGGVNWSPQVRVDSLPYAAVSGPVVQLASGRLIVPFYGRFGAETIDSVWIGYSDDNGVTWAQTRILNGQTLGTPLQEPWISRKPGGDDLLMTYRYGTAANIGASYTANATGITGWSAAAAMFSGTGRPSSTWLTTGEAIVQYRNLGNVRHLARACDSPESASGWGRPYVARNCQGAGQGSVGLWTYGQAIEVGRGAMLGLWSEENNAGTVSKVYATGFARGGGMTPLGPVPDNASAIACLYDRVEVAVDMLAGKGSLYPNVPPELTVLSGNLTALEVTNNLGIWVLSSAVADGTPDRAYVDTGVSDVAIEADFAGTVQSGYALLFRLVDASNYLMFTVENTFLNLRLYKVVAGVATQLANLAQPTPADSWQTLRVEARGSLIACFRNGYPALIYNLTAGAEQNTFNTPTKHGLSLNAQSGGSHFCRRFTIWSYGL
jgi:hypothetical protein